MRELVVVRQRDVAADDDAVRDRVGGQDALASWYVPAAALPADTRVAAELVPLPDGATRVRLTGRQPVTGLRAQLQRRRRADALARVLEDALRALDLQLRPPRD